MKLFRRKRKFGPTRAERRSHCFHWLVNTSEKTATRGSWTDKATHYVVFARTAEEALRKAGIMIQEQKQ